MSADITEKARSGACVARPHCGAGHAQAARAVVFRAQTLS